MLWLKEHCAKSQITPNKLLKQYIFFESVSYLNALVDYDCVIHICFLGDMIDGSSLVSCYSLWQIQGFLWVYVKTLARAKA